MKKNKYFKENLKQSLDIERLKRTAYSELNYIIKNPEKGKILLPKAVEDLDDIVNNRLSKFDHIMMLEKPIESFYTFRKEMKKILPIEKELKLNQFIELFTLNVGSYDKDPIVQGRLEELKPQYKEILSFLLEEREKLIGKRSFYWIGSFEELKKLYNGLISENLISNKTKIEDFNKVFTYEPISEINKINWTGQSNLLAYLIDELINNKRFEYYNESFSIARECFTNANNLTKLKYQYIEINKTSKPRKYHIIDNILKTIDNPS